MSRELEEMSLLSFENSNFPNDITPAQGRAPKTKSQRVHVSGRAASFITAAAINIAFDLEAPRKRCDCGAPG
jgi:hypothetical protein